MKLRFDAHQPFQVRAVEAVADLLDGQPPVEAAVDLGPGDLPAVANRLDLDEPRLVANLRRVQEDNGIRPDDGLRFLEEEIEAPGGTRTVRFPNFSVEMETGTGKTYVYLRTMLELFHRYRLRKFIVVVPSVAIREGVLKSLEVTRDHFARLYGNTVLRHAAYDASSRSQVSQFALSGGVEVLVMTIDAFNKAANVIRRSADRLQGRAPIEYIQAARPVLILDEPQNMESPKSRAALASLDPLLALRYSATHRRPYNLVCRLTPFDAYRQGLVKRIEVASVAREEDAGRPWVRVAGVRSGRRSVTARLAVRKLSAGGAPRESTVTVRAGDSLAEKTARSEYRGFDVDEIDAGREVVRFSNGVELRAGEEHGPDREALFREQIRLTLDEHFRKQDRLRGAGIKVLSLFFIDRVANYAGPEALIRRLFDEAFDALKGGWPEWRDLAPEAVQAGYFAHRRRGGAVEWLDSVSGESAEDAAAYSLIMRDKEALLSFPGPADCDEDRRRRQVAFLFSHSALREGWDNPNVFQICTLNQSVSEVRKRQEVGRGMRLCVDQEGRRVRDGEINVLTVVANESYRRYAAGLQSEIAEEYRAEIESRCGRALSALGEAERRRLEEEYGAGILPPAPRRAGSRPSAGRDGELSPEFRRLWERVEARTRFALRIDTDRLVAGALGELESRPLSRPGLTVARGRIQVKGPGAFEAQAQGETRGVAAEGGGLLPNLLETMADLLERASPPVRVTRRTLLEIFRAAPDPEAALASPHEFAAAAAAGLRGSLAGLLARGVQYERRDGWYEMSQVEEGDPLSFAGLEGRGGVELCARLPRSFTVPTPAGACDPDWAVVTSREGEGWRLYLLPRRRLTRRLGAAAGGAGCPPEAPVAGDAGLAPAGAPGAG